MLHRLVFLSVILVGCGGRNDASPELIPGGGVSSGEIDGKLNVYVIDDRTGTPITGASVRVGTAEITTPPTGTTDATGLVVFEDDSLDGPQMVTVTAPSHAAATWIGVNGANVTIPVTPTTAPPAVPFGTVTGTINGWTSLPDSDFPGGIIVAGIVLSSAIEPLDSPENNIPQLPTAIPNVTANTCIRNMTTPCSYTLRARTGKQALYALIVRVNTQGTTTTADDTITLLGYGLRRGLDVTDGQTLTNQDLDQIAAVDQSTLSMVFQSPPSGLTDLAAIPLVRLGEEGLLALVVPPLTPSSPSKQVPALVGPLSGATYDVLASASGSTPGMGAQSMLRGVSLGTVDTGTWLAPPMTLTASSFTFGFTPPAEASVAIGAFTGSGSLAWTIAVLDGSTTFTLPTLSPDPLPSGTVNFSLAAAEVPDFDPEDFQANEVEGAITRLSSNRLTFTH